ARRVDRGARPGWQDHRHGDPRPRRARCGRRPVCGVLRNPFDRGRGDAPGTPVQPRAPPVRQPHLTPRGLRDIFTSMKTLSDAIVPLERCQVECVEPEKAAAVRERLPGEAVSQELAETFRVLADAGRVRLILALLEGGELCVCDLAAVTGLSQTACSHNLRLLRAGRIVSYRR